MCCDSWGRKESDTTERLNCTSVESNRVREPRRTALPCGSMFGFYDDGISFQVCL